MARSKFSGLGEMQQALKALPDAVRREMVKPLEETGKDLAAAMQAAAPQRTGRLRAAIKYKVYATALRLVVGLLDVKAGRDALFYGRIQDLGRRAQLVTVQRTRGGFAKKLATGKGRIMASGNVRDTYVMRVKAMAGKKFVTGRYSDLRTGLRAKLSASYDDAVSSVVDRS